MYSPPNPDVRGFLPDEEGRQLWEWACIAGQVGPILEVGSYCGRSTIWLAQAAKHNKTVVFALDHHRGSDEHQPGESHHDPSLIDASGRVDTLAAFRRNIQLAGVEDHIIAVVTQSAIFAKFWAGMLGLVFIDGGHSLDAALLDYRSWFSRITPGGILAIHDVFPDPADGGQAPFAIWQLATQSGLFEPLGTVGSLRGLRRI